MVLEYSIHSLQSFAFPKAGDLQDPTAGPHQLHSSALKKATCLRGLLLCYSKVPCIILRDSAHMVGVNLLTVLILFALVYHNKPSLWQP